jgi:hypothetical protein
MDSNLLKKTEYMVFIRLFLWNKWYFLRQFLWNKWFFAC